MWLDEAVSVGIPYTTMKNIDGAVITPGAASVLFTVMEMGVPLPTDASTSLDMTGVSGPNAWPMTAYAYV
jgi:hypothetical protein